MVLQHFPVDYIAVINEPDWYQIEFQQITVLPRMANVWQKFICQHLKMTIILNYLSATCKALFLRAGVRH